MNSKNVKKSEYSGAITGLDFVSGQIKLEAHDTNNIVGNVTVDMGEIPHNIVEDFIRELVENYDEIPSLYNFAEKHFNSFNESTKKSKMKKSKLSKMSIDEIINNPDDSFRYQMLGRLQSDMDYYFGNGGRYEGHLWTHDFDSQIDFMKRLWDSFQDKPEWLKMEEIEDYAKYKNMPGWYYHPRYSDGSGGYWDKNEDHQFRESTKKSKMKKTPIINLYGHDDDTSREIEFYDSGADVTAQEIEALAPSAEVIVDMGAVDVIWRLPSGNHPGLWITTHGKGRQGVHVTANYFDYPDVENVSGFLDYIQDKYGRKSYDLVNSGSGLPAEEIKEAIREMENELGKYALQTKMPIYNASTKKSYIPDYQDFRSMVKSIKNTGNHNNVFKE